MRLAILSDIHGNLEAFQAVIHDISGREVDGIVSLGDMVGYGPDPEEVVQAVRRLQCHSLLGNHEDALFSEAARRWMNFQARENNIQTGLLLSPESLAYCRGLPRSLRLGRLLLVHGFPPDSVFAYLYNQPDRKIVELFASSSASLFFVGHTHDLELVRRRGEDIVRESLDEGRLRLEPGEKYIINAGSVGQPRDGDKRAKYLIWDAAARELAVLCIPYDFRSTARKILARGFPEIYAERLG